MSDQPSTVTKVVVVGHVDHGKSTLLGRLMLDCGKVPADKIQNVKNVCDSKRIQFEPAFLFDALQEEQEQGISIDTTRVNIEFEGRKFVLIDAPGHLEFLKNMTSGASEAEFGVLTVDCLQGMGSQTERHLKILSMLGIEQVLVALNKVDQIDYDQLKYERISAQVRQVIVDLGLICHDVIPISALAGENITTASERLSWYLGKPLLTRLLELATRKPDRSEEGAEPFRMLLQDVYRFGTERYFVGRVLSGLVKLGDELFFSPSGKVSNVQAIERFPATSLQQATRGESIALRLKEQIFVERGEIVSLLDELPIVDTEFRASIVWLSRNAFKPEVEYLIKLGTDESLCRIFPDSTDKWAATVDTIDNGSFVDVSITLAKQMAFDLSKGSNAVNKFVLCTQFETVAAGVIHAVPSRKQRELHTNPDVRQEYGHLEREQLEAKNGHKGSVLWMTGLSGAGKSTLAKVLERELFDLGCQTVVLDGDNLRLGLCADLGFSPEDRSENIRRLAHTARLFLDRGFVVITAAISPFAQDRLAARDIIGADDFHELFIFCPIDECQRRDPKGLYSKANQGQVRSLTGVDSPYQPPQRPALRLDSSKMSVTEETNAVISLLVDKCVISGHTSRSANGTAAALDRNQSAWAKSISSTQTRNVSLSQNER